MSLEQFKGKYIPILDWKFFDNDQEENEYRDTYDIDDNYKLLGTTIVGDVLAPAPLELHSCGKNTFK